MLAEEKKQVAELNDRLMQPLEIRLIMNGDARSQILKTFSRELVENAPKIRMTIETDDRVDSMPGLYAISSIVYHATPHGMELPPFLDMLADVSELNRTGTQVGPIKGVEIPAMLKLYVSSVCTFCPAVVRKLVSLVLQNTNIQLKIIDGLLFPEMVENDHIRSVPTVILDDQFRWTGPVDGNELLSTIRHRDSSLLSAGTLASMISDGEAYRLAEMMLKAGRIFPAFLDLLTHEAFSTRLGAMAVAEEIAEKCMPLAVRMAVPLSERFEQQVDAVKGDVLYIMGATCDERILDFLEKISSGEYLEDVKEAATEAMVEIRSR